MTEMIAKLDDLGTPMWVALLVLAFVMFWPAGLALLAFLLLSGRLGGGGGPTRPWCSRMTARSQRWSSARRPYWGSGNSAFDEYREQTLRRLEEEHREFQEFLAQLRMAKDRTEFDRFMQSRRPNVDDEVAAKEEGGDDPPDDEQPGKPDAPDSGH